MLPRRLKKKKKHNQWRRTMRIGLATTTASRRLPRIRTRGRSHIGASGEPWVGAPARAHGTGRALPGRRDGHGRAAFTADALWPAAGAEPVLAQGPWEALGSFAAGRPAAVARGWTEETEGGTAGALCSGALAAGASPWYASFVLEGGDARALVAALCPDPPGGTAAAEALGAAGRPTGVAWAFFGSNPGGGPLLGKSRAKS
ncbi:unnamed protein product [Prorocentrum cordatum]|uniref:Uncharacterized protein n=1 Tax=Prorocentrum cordatum TaxID=2364126 RepID=A0ABN9RKD1_9DINO|nr:unnamed protein product [Polarella glacialis]